MLPVQLRTSRRTLKARVVPASLCRALSGGSKANGNGDFVTNGWKLVTGKETNALETNIGVQEAA